MIYHFLWRQGRKPFRLMLRDNLVSIFMYTDDWILKYAKKNKKVAQNEADKSLIASYHCLACMPNIPEFCWKLICHWIHHSSGVNSKLSLNFEIQPEHLTIFSDGFWGWLEDGMPWKGTLLSILSNQLVLHLQCVADAHWQIWTQVAPSPY